MHKISVILALTALLISCEKTDEINALVPATVDENSELPSVSIHVAGHDRLVHYRTFGYPMNPVFFILHGSASDMRA